MGDEESGLPWTGEDQSASEDLAETFNEVSGGMRCDVILTALCMMSAHILRIGSQGDVAPLLSSFAGVMRNIHAGIASELPQAQDIVRVVGDGLSEEQAKAATELCPFLGALMSGLLLNYDTKNVMNAWLSNLLTLLMRTMEVGDAQTVLRLTADALPQTKSQIDGMASFDNLGNTGQVGRA